MSSIDASSLNLPFKYFINPIHGITHVDSDIDRIICSPKGEDGSQYIACVHGDHIIIRSFKDFTSITSVSASHLTFDTMDPPTISFVSNNNNIMTCSISLDNCSDLSNVASSHIKLLLSNIIVTTDNIIRHVTGDFMSYYFKDHALTIIDGKRYRDSYFFLCDNGLIYAFISEDDKLVYQAFEERECPLGLSSNPCQLSHLSSQIESFDISQQGHIVLLHTKTSSLGFVTPNNADITYEPYGNINNPSRIIYNHFHLNPFIIDTENRLYSRLEIYNNQHIHFGQFYDQFTNTPNDDHNIKSYDCSNDRYGILTDGDIYLSGSSKYNVFLNASQGCIGVSLSRDTDHTLLLYENSVSFLEYPYFISLNTTMVKIAQYDNDMASEYRPLRFYMKTIENTLYYVEGELDKEIHVFQLEDHYIEDVSNSFITIRNNQSELEYYGIGANNYGKYGSHPSYQFIFEDDISLADIDSNSTHYFKFMKIHFDDIDHSNIKKVIHGYQNMFVITNDNLLYGRGDNSAKTISNNGLENIYTFTRIYGAFNGKELCNVHTSYSPIILVETCDGSVYQQGYRDFDFLQYQGKTLVSPYHGVYASRLLLLLGSPLQCFLADSGRMIIISGDVVPNECEGDHCDNNDAVDEIIGDKLVIGDIQRVITSNLTIVDSVVIIEVSNDVETPIIVDGRSLVLNSTSLTYQIGTQDIYDSIVDGQRVVIIDTKGDGRIDGEFIGLDLKLSNINDECKVIEGQLEQNEKQVSIVFKVKDKCSNGFPLWAILVITIGLLIVIVVVVLLIYVFVYKKKIFVSKKASNQRTKDEVGETTKNQIYESGKTLRNPVYE